MRARLAGSYWVVEWLTSDLLASNPTTFNQINLYTLPRFHRYMISTGKI